MCWLLIGIGGTASGPVELPASGSGAYSSGSPSSLLLASIFTMTGISSSEDGSTSEYVGPFWFS